MGHFKDLVGNETILEKRNAESEPNFQPLTPTSKVKQPKKGQFTLKRKKSISQRLDMSLQSYIFLSVVLYNVHVLAVYFRTHQGSLLLSSWTHPLGCIWAD